MHVADYVIIGIIVFACLLIVVLQLIPQHDSKKNINKLREAPFQFRRLRKSWLNSELVFLTIEYSLIGLSFASTIAVVYITSEPINDTARIILYSILSFMFSITNIVIKPKSIATSYRKAFNKLNSAILRYEYTNEFTKDIDSQTYNELVEAVQAGESLIAKGVDMDC